MIGYELVDVYDNVLEPEAAKLIDGLVRNCDWRFDYSSHSGKPNKHWHIFCGHNTEEITDLGFDWLLPIWEAAKHKYDFEEKYHITKFKRLYMNAHTHGIEPHIHRDDGDVTMIYYPRMDWHNEWGGGTIVLDEEYNVEKHVTYKGNRLMVFPAHCMHQAQPVSRQCFQLRTCIVFKTVVDGGNPERLNHYGKN